MTKLLRKQKHIISNRFVLIQHTSLIFAEKLADSDVLVCTVIGFPLGANTTETKVFETEDAIRKGADEIDMVINIGALKDQRYDDVQKDIEAVVKVAEGKTVKVIIETALLTEEEKVKASELTKAKQVPIS
ncbi:deoxyribose-phosphate aldolase [Staphylococcus pseudintermedius]|uniref:deoxyribose-phosphate aldolase n=1 Tax=Staphylococcus pseudintermedius TaxID=283734 RepID=UPI00311A981C